MIRKPLLYLLLLFVADVAWADQRPNVLMILVDDLKPALGCYGDSVAQSPNIDALAARGMRFDLAYCNQAVCAPSRYTLMLGSHSTSTGLYGLGSDLRATLPAAITLPQHFAKHGYRTESLGKVFHIGHGNQGDPESFSVPHWKEKVIEYVDPASTDGGKLTREEAFFTNQQLDRIPSLPRGAAFESPDVADEAYADGRVAEETILRLKAAKQRRDQEGTPFFIVAGFARPHLPFSVPKKYWDLYDPTGLPMPTSHDAPAGSPPVANKRGGEIANYAPVPENPNATYEEDLKRKLIHGYYAGVSYIDAQVGKLIGAIDELQLDDNTIVVLWGDHGFHLGDHGIWTKHTNYEQANRIPLLFVTPGDAFKSGSTNQPAESADVYPTLCELAGLPAPSGPQPMDGLSLANVLKDPGVRVRDHAYHAFPKRLLGRSIRTERYRMVQWQPWSGEEKGSLYELYDYQTDPGETRNLAKALPDVLKQHQLILATYPAPIPQAGTVASKAKPVSATEPGVATSLVQGLSQLGRPLFCTVYMARGNQSTFEGILPILHQHRIAAYNWGFVDGRSQTIYPWDSWQKAYTEEPKPWFHDIFRTDGTPYNSKETRLIHTLAIQSPTKQSRAVAVPGAMPPDEVKAGLETHDRALFIHNAWIRDPYITRGADGIYYLTGTTLGEGDPRESTDPYNTGLGPRSLVGSVVRVWKSADLISWDSLPTPYTLRDGVWDDVRPKAFETTPADEWRLWAPELHWIGDRWALVHTSPAPIAAANLSLSPGNEVSGPWSNPMGEAIGKRHDPSLFQDDDGTWWLIWGATTIAPLKPDFSGLAGKAVEIRPSGDTSKMGHEGCLIRKINGKYVLFGTGWSTGKMRQGSYNLYYATADQITGPYSERKFVGRFLGHGTPFQDNDDRWWCTAFFNANVPPLPSEGIEDRDLSKTAQTINQRGTTLVPLEVKTLEDGTLFIRAKDPAYAVAGPDEAQDFRLRQ